uniref:Uncharacterized protein n=1 Tax=Amphimedon queenslandica TaxID=400682 RepID=A0A1X7U3I0_AMPQE
MILMSSSFKYWPQVLFILIAPLTRLVVPLMCILQLVLLLVTKSLADGVGINKSFKMDLGLVW